MMRRRSSKILAVTLALALGLNAMPFGALAVQETAGAVVSEETTLASTPETAATAETAQNTVEADANRADVAMLAEVYAQSSADAPMAVPGEALVIQNGVYYGISKSWFESVNPEKEKMYFAVSIPSSVTTIANDGFQDTWSSDKQKYDAVTIKDGVGSYAIVSVDFSQATSLTTIKSQAAMNTSLAGVLDLSNTKLETIEKSAFSGCTGITGVILPQTLRYMGTQDGTSGSVFKQCSALQYVRVAGGDPDVVFELPENLEVIGKQSFYKCTGLPENTTVKIPASVTIVGSEAFYYTPNITTIIVETENAASYDGAAFKGSEYGFGKRLTVFKNAAAKKTFTPSGSSSYANSITYEFTLQFDNVASEQKLYGQPLYICKDADGNWFANENYSLPEAPAVEPKEGYQGGWANEGKLINMHTALKPDGDILVLTAENVLQDPDVEFIVDGKVLAAEDTYPKLNLTNDTVHTIGVQVSHPLENAEDSDVEVRFEYEWTDVWDGGKQGPRMEEDGFGRYNAQSNPDVTNTITIRGAQDERTNGQYSGTDYGDGYYLLEIYGYEKTKDSEQWTLFYKSASTAIASDPQRTVNTAYLFDVVTSAPATKPEVTAQDLTVEYGYDQAALEASVTEVAGNTYTYQWYEATQEGQVENGTAIQGANAKTLSLPTGKAAGMYYYYFEATATNPLNGDTKTTAVPVKFVVTEVHVVIWPASITVYMGGDNGADAVVGEDNKITASNSLPEAGFTFNLPKAIGDPSELVFFEESSGKTWTVEPYDGKAEHKVYRIVPAKGQDPVRLQFTDADGHAVVSDAFTVGEAVNKEFSMSLYKGSTETVMARKAGDPNGTAFEIELQTGTLTVRGTTANVQYGELNKEAEAGKPAVSAPEGTTFTINESNVVASADGVALLFDDIIENTQSESNRKALLEAKVNEVLKDVTVPADKVRAFDMKYLDLVDTQNGNAWVKASNPVTVSWPYPEGTDQNTDFTLLHFEDLHRDMAANDVANSIANAKVSPVKVTKTATHIEFTTDGFSPFVLVWNTDKPAKPTPPPEPGDNEGDNNNNGNSGNGSNNGGTTSATPAPTAQPAEVKNTTAQPAAAAVIPQTGDESHPMLWVVLLAVSGSLAAVLAYKRRKEER